MSKLTAIGFGSLSLVAVALSLGCSDRPLDLPEPNASSDDLNFPLVDIGGHRSDMMAVDLNTRDTVVPVDLATGDLDMVAVCKGTDVDCGGSCPTPCDIGLACLVDSDCASNACDGVSFICVFDPCHDHRQDALETAVDCGNGICIACANGQPCVKDSNCADETCDAVSLTCAPTSCKDDRQDGHESDVDCGGSDSCPRCIVGRKCIVVSDCTPGHVCALGVCATAQCTDGELDGNETSVDCGGGSCPLCPLGDACRLDSDCASNACDTTALTCRTSACGDRRKDGNETDIDCGGACEPCPLDKKCLLDSDCSSNACDALSRTCVASQCGDHLKDGNETDVDCGGACPPCGYYKTCSSDADCASNVCDVRSLICVDNWCGDGQKDGNETDVDCGGECAGCGLNSTCRVDQDCASTAGDGLSLICVTSQCDDQRQEVYESDVDCGGPCPGCVFGQMCFSNEDCLSGACSVQNLCQLPWCSDGVRDGGETDIDCGGSTCPACAIGKMCAIDSDCATQACDGGALICVADQCIDHRQDNTETDIDCGGTTCAARCAVGDRCIVTSDCMAGHICPISNPHVCM